MPSLVEIAQVAIAVATILAVAVALFRDEIRSWWHRPLLSGSIRLAPPDCHLTEVRSSAPPTFRREILETVTPCYYFRLWVKNGGGEAAEQVQVFAAQLLRQHADGEFRDEPSFLPMNLHWSHSREIYAPRISPDMGRHCDLGYILKSNPTRFRLDLEVVPFTGADVLDPATYRLALRIAAGNARPVDCAFEITFRGVWHDDEQTMFRDAIGIRMVDRRA